jgi:hypothetical protein
MDTGIKPPFAVLEPVQVVAVPETDEIQLPADASSLDFLQAVYRSSQQPMQRRMRAAIEALPFERPKLAVIATVHRFADQMRSIARATGKSNVIDAPKPAGNRVANSTREIG